MTNEVSKRHFEANSTDAVIDTFHPDSQLCELTYARDNGIGIITPDGEKEHIEWPIAKERYVPASKHNT